MLEKEKCDSVDSKEKITEFLEEIVSFNNSLRLYHWNVEGKGSYSHHVTLRKALIKLDDYADSISEISYAIIDTMDITVPETKCPKNIFDVVKKYVAFIENGRPFFCEIFMQSILDDFQQTLEQLMFRLKRLT